MAIPHVPERPVRRSDGTPGDWVQLGTHASVRRYASYKDTIGFGAAPAAGPTHPDKSAAGGAPQ